jgi:hypothetical protein
MPFDGLHSREILGSGLSPAAADQTLEYDSAGRLESRSSD